MKTFSLFRIYKIVWMAVVIFVKIFWFQKRHKIWDEGTEQAWNRLMKKQAERYKNTAVELEGLLIKVGQFLSARADLLPRVFIDELEGLIDHVPALPWETAKKTIEEQWGMPYEHVMQEIGDRPVASASIGEVYKGILQSGETVAIKIQRRDIEKIMHIDYKAIRIVVWLMKRLTSIGKKINLVGLYYELVAVTNRELDFRKERENGEFFRNAFVEDQGIYIPVFYEQYSTKKVLVMEWVDGHKVTDQAFLKEHGVNPRRLADTVIHCFIKQCLHLGKFHADPHAGNLFVQENGRLVLLDFGMISGIDKRDISSLLQLLEGLFFEDYRKVFGALEDLRFLLPSANEREMEHAIKTIVDVYMHHGNKEINSDLMEEMLKEITEMMRKQPIQLPSEFAFLGRAVSVLVGVIYSIDPTIDFLESARPAVHEWIDSDQESFQASAIEYVKDWAKPFLQFPVLTKDILKYPDRRLDWERQKQRDQYLHDVYVSQKRYAMLSFLISIAALFASLFFDKGGLAIGCASFSGVTLIYHIIASVKHMHWIRSLKGRR